MADFYFAAILENILKVFRAEDFVAIFQHLLVFPSLFPGTDVSPISTCTLGIENLFHLAQWS